MKIYIAIHDIKTKQQEFPLQIVKTMDRARELNDKGYGIFGTVNDFNHRRIESDVKKLNAFYVDFDGVAKEKQLDALKNFLMPSMVIESKNGYHCYWFIKNDLVEEFGVDMANKIYKEINKRLIFWLGNGADEGVYDAARVLRVPGFFHLKDPNNPFLIEEVFAKDISYTLNEMLLWLKPRPSKKKVATQTKQNIEGDDFWEAAHAIDCESGLLIISGHTGVSGDTFDVEKGQIFVNGERSQCWIDDNGMIGSHSNGGPTLPNWINWYHSDWSTTAKILVEVFPGLTKPSGISLDF